MDSRASAIVAESNTVVNSAVSGYRVTVTSLTPQTRDGVWNDTGLVTEAHGNDSRHATFWPGRVARHCRPAWTLCPREAPHPDGNGRWSTFRRAVNRSMRVLQFVAAS